MCISPIHIKNTNNVRKYSMHAVPCSRCYECRLRRGAGWAFRLQQEEKLHATAHFLTLTYSDQYIPSGGSLDKTHLQKFFKILRKKEKNVIKYYACGEYGTKTQRPHYHAIMFGAKPDNIAKSWHYGHLRIDPVTPASIAYVCGYVNKPFHEFKDGRQKEFSLMSKKLGSNYLTPQMQAWHKNNLAAYCVMPGGAKIAIPRYYRDKIFDAKEKEILAEIGELLHETQLFTSIQKNGYQKHEHERNESVKAAIRRQDYYLTLKRNAL